MTTMPTPCRPPRLRLRDGREVYRVKLITPQGRVRVLHEDPARAPRAEAQRPKIRQDGRRPYDE